VSEPEAEAQFNDATRYLEAAASLSNDSLGLPQRTGEEPDRFRSQVFGRPYGRVLLIVPDRAALPFALILPLSLICAGNRVIFAASGSATQLALRLAGLVGRYAPDRLRIWPFDAQLALDLSLASAALDALFCVPGTDDAAYLRQRAADRGVTVLSEALLAGAAVIDGALPEAKIIETACRIVDAKSRSDGRLVAAPSVVLTERRQAPLIRSAFQNAAARAPLRLPLRQALDRNSSSRLSALATMTGIEVMDRCAAALFDAPSLSFAVEAKIFGPASYLVQYESPNDMIAALADVWPPLRQLSIFSESPGFVQDLVSRTKFDGYCVNQFPFAGFVPSDDESHMDSSCRLPNFFKLGRSTVIVEGRLSPITTPQIAVAHRTPPALEKRCFLWGHPRSRSTALERAFIEREDCVVLHEPLSKFAYFGGDVLRVTEALFDEARFVSDPYLDDVRFSPAQPKYGIVKDFPYHALPYLTDEFLRAFKHIVLIREPGSSIRSLQVVQPGFREDEVGYIELLALARRIKEGLNEEVHLVEAEDFARDPERILRGCCEFIDMPYEARMLHWSRREDIPAWHLWKGFHDAALASTTISPPRPNGSSANLSPSHHALIRSLEPIYRSILAEFRTGSSRPS
jgi:acyl-CoA reductase-like NAD-dependent aldehyde dehydrogenase